MLRDEKPPNVSFLGTLRARSGRTTGHSEAGDGPADGALAGADLGSDLVEGHAALVEAARSLHLTLSEAELATSTPTVEVGGHGRAVDAVRLGQRDHALSGLMAGDQFVDLDGGQEGLSRPDLPHHEPVSPGGAGLSTVNDPSEGPPLHA